MSMFINAFRSSRPELFLREKYMQQIHRKAPMPKCDFNKAAKQLYSNQTSAWVLS